MLFTLFTEPRVGQAPVKRLEDDSRSCRNCRHIYSLMAGGVAIAPDMLYSLVVDPAGAAITDLQGIFRWSLYIFTEQEWPMAKRVHHDTHAQCCKLSQLLHNHVFTERGVRARSYGVRLPDHRHLG